MGNQIFTGCQILKISSFCPCSNLGLQPFLDFIIDIKPLEEAFQPNDFQKVIQKLENQRITMTIYNAFYNQERKVQVIPNKNWQDNNGSFLGNNQRGKELGLGVILAWKWVILQIQSKMFLGISIRVNNYSNYLQSTFKILTITPSSFAST